MGEDLPVDRTPRYSVYVNATAKAGITVRKMKPLTESSVTALLNQLVCYRSKNLVKAYESDFDAPGSLPADVRPIANALGACVADSPALQSELISLLAPYIEQRLADHSASLEGVTIESILSLAHQGKSRLLAREIAAEVNRISKARGERLEYKAENIGHALKKVGLVTKRLGKEGRGLVVDQTTLMRVHELAAGYGGVGLDAGDENLHCHLCTEKKWVM